MMPYNMFCFKVYIFTLFFFFNFVSSVTAIDTVSPIGMIKSELFPYGSTGREWFVTVTWKPTKIQLGSHMFCFTAADNIGYGI